MKIEITLINGKIIVVEFKKTIDVDDLKENIDDVLNNNGKFIWFQGNTFDNDYFIKKEQIESIRILKGDDTNELQR